LSDTAHTPDWLKYFKQKCDFFDLLNGQVEDTKLGIIGLCDWLKSGAPDRCTVVHELEHRADKHKNEIEKNLRDSFVTPFDREEIYDISQLLDLVINGAKRLVKDIEFFEDDVIDEHLIEMSAVLVTGMEFVSKSVRNLNSDLSESAKAADEARKTEVHVGKIYRKAMKQLYEKADFKELLRKKQLYDYMLSIAERTERLAEKLLHVSIKLG
jgi:uncharacterized protein Yka (UPF0111/DUF47 family)